MIDQYPQDASSYGVKVARGTIGGAQPFGAFGEATPTGATTDNVIWANGAFVNPPAAGIQLSLVSASANDTAAGTGIRTIEIQYLDANLAEQTEVVTLNGVGAVTTVATNIRFVNGFHMKTYGSGKSAAGIITASNGGVTYAQINATKTRAACSARMVPAGKKLFIDSLFAGSTSGSSAAKVTVQICASKLGSIDYTADSIFIPYGSASYQDNSAGLNVSAPLVFNAGTAVAMLYTTDKAATITASWFGWLENA